MVKFPVFSTDNLACLNIATYKGHIDNKVWERLHGIPLSTILMINNAIIELIFLVSENCYMRSLHFPSQVLFIDSKLNKS